LELPGGINGKQERRQRFWQWRNPGLLGGAWKRRISLGRQW